MSNGRLISYLVIVRRRAEDIVNIVVDADGLRVVLVSELGMWISASYTDDLQIHIIFLLFMPLWLNIKL